MRSTSLAWEQKQRGEHIITSQRKTESCLSVCLHHCVRTFSTSAATAVSWGRRLLQEEAAEPGGAGGRKHQRIKRQRYNTGIYVMQNQVHASVRVYISRAVNIQMHTTERSLSLSVQLKLVYQACSRNWLDLQERNREWNVLKCSLADVHP